MYFLDTNYLIRFLTRDIATQAETARQIITSKKSIYIPTIVLAETVYILENHYQISKIQVCNQLISLLKQKHISSDIFTPLALQIYKKETISFYDCLLCAQAIDNYAQLKTFDQKLHKVYLHYQAELSSRITPWQISFLV